MSSARGRYMAYLLRLWQVDEAEDGPWRASLESPQTGERQGFASVVDLFIFLENEIGQVVQGQPTSSVGEKGDDIDES